MSTAVYYTAALPVEQSHATRVVRFKVATRFDRRVGRVSQIIAVGEHFDVVSQFSARVPLGNDRVKPALFDQKSKMVRARLRKAVDLAHWMLETKAQNPDVDVTDELVAEVADGFANDADATSCIRTAILLLRNTGLARHEGEP